MKRYSTTSSSAPTTRASTDGGVGGYIPDVFVNAFTKLHKTDRKWIEIRERADKLDEDIGHVEKLMARIVRKEGEIGLDYAEMSGQVNKLQSLEPNLAEAFASFARALDSTAMATTLLKETTDTSYFESLRDLSSYLASLRGLLKFLSLPLNFLIKWSLNNFACSTSRVKSWILISNLRNRSFLLCS